jgi:hypothetical protein
MLYQTNVNAMIAKSIQETQKMLNQQKTPEELEQLITEKGLRYVIQHYKIPESMYDDITSNKYSDLREEEDITKEMLIFYQSEIEKLRL